MSRSEISIVKELTASPRVASETGSHRISIHSRTMLSYLRLRSKFCWSRICFLLSLVEDVSPAPLEAPLGFGTDGNTRSAGVTDLGGMY